LDTSRSHAVKDLTLVPVDKNRWCLSIAGERDMLLEKWRISKRKSLFEEVFGVSLDIA
jgi:hypothetical protein